MRRDRCFLCRLTLPAGGEASSANFRSLSRIRSLSCSCSRSMSDDDSLTSRSIFWSALRQGEDARGHCSEEPSKNWHETIMVDMSKVTSSNRQAMPAALSSACIESGTSSPSWCRHCSWVVHDWGFETSRSKSSKTTEKTTADWKAEAGTILMSMGYFLEKEGR